MQMKARKLSFYLLSVLLGGCVPVISLYPLYDDGNLIFEEKLLGTWVDTPDSPEMTWQFKRVVDRSREDWELEPPEKPEKAYQLVLVNNQDGTKGSFYAHLVKLKNRLFLDVYPSQLPCARLDPKQDWVFNTIFFIPGHSFIIIDSIEPQLKMRWTTEDEMKKLLKDEPKVVKHELVEGRVILTASTEQLQQFVLKYADDRRVFPAEVVLTRKQSNGPDAP
jgi:hypothetical protein